MTESKNSFNAKSTLEVGDKSYDYFALSAVPGMEKLPYSLKVLGENLLRTEDGANITNEHIELSPTGMHLPIQASKSSSPQPVFSCRTSPVSLV